jgi:hypothetical protein
MIDALDRAAARFLHMICAGLPESLLFGGEAAGARLDRKPHVEHVIDTFLLGATPRK